MWDQDTLLWKERRSRHHQGPPAPTRVSAERQPEESLHFLPRRAPCVVQPGPAAPVAATALDDELRGAVTPAAGGVLDASNSGWVTARVDGLDSIIELRNYLDFHVGRTIAHHFPGRSDGRHDPYYASMRTAAGGEASGALLPNRRGGGVPATSNGNNGYGSAHYAFDYYIQFVSPLAASTAVRQRIFQMEREATAAGAAAAPTRYQINATISWCQDVLFLEQRKKKAALRDRVELTLTLEPSDDATAAGRKSRPHDAAPNGHRGDSDTPTRSSAAAADRGHPLLNRREGTRVADSALRTPPPGGHVEDWLQGTAAPSSRSPSHSDPLTSTSTTTTTTASSSSLGREEEPRGWNPLHLFRREAPRRSRSTHGRPSAAAAAGAAGGASSLHPSSPLYTETATLSAVSLFYFSELHQRGAAVLFLVLRLAFVLVWTLSSGVRRVVAALFYVGSGGGRRARTEAAAAGTHLAAHRHHHHHHHHQAPPHHSVMLADAADGGDYDAAQVRRHAPWCGLWGSPLSLLAAVFYYLCRPIAPPAAEVDLRLWSWVQMGTADPQRSIQRLRKKLALALPPPLYSGPRMGGPNGGLSSFYYYDRMNGGGPLFTSDKQMHMPRNGSSGAVLPQLHRKRPFYSVHWGALWTGFASLFTGSADDYRYQSYGASQNPPRYGSDNMNSNINNNNNNINMAASTAAGRFGGSPGALADVPLVSEVVMRWQPTCWFLQYSTWSLLLLLVALYYNIGFMARLFV